MHKKTLNNRLRLSLMALAIGTVSLGSGAAGLGRITVMSSLGQPLRAEVEIAATPEELQNITARLASADAFRQAGIDYSPSVTGLRMAVERRGNGAVVRVSSDRPINEPFVDMLVELNWSAGRLIREYTFLLDPPDAGAPRAAAVAVPEVRSDMARPGVAPAPAAVRRAPASRPAAVPTASDRSYLVKPGDTLNRIAMETRPDGVSVDQMLSALFQGNRGAFAADDINRLQAGKVLRIPDADGVRQLAPGGRQVVAQSSDFGRYRQRLAEQAAASAPKEAPARQSASGRIGARVEDKAQGLPAGSDQLKVSKGADAASLAGGGADKPSSRLQALEEDLVSRDKALKDANARLAELEKSIRELQRLVELKSQGFAQTQDQAAKPAAAPAVVPPPPPAPVPPPAAVVPPPEAAIKPPEAEKPADLAPPPPPPPAPEVKPAPPPPPAPAPASAEASSGPDMSLLLGGGGIAALLLGWGAYRLFGKRRNNGAPTTTPAYSEFGEGSSSVFGSAGGQSVDTGSSSQIQTDFSQSGLSSIDTDEGVDPVAEADVYMAYGRDAQAEEILLDALKTDPGRTGVHLKLLEIYAQRKNLKQFETTATELYSLTGGNGPDWEKAAALGRKVDPDSPLYRIPVPGAMPGPSAIPVPAVSELGPHTIAGTMAPATGFVQAGEARQAPPMSARPAPAPAPIAPSGDDDPLESPSQLKDTWALPGELNQYTSLNDLDHHAPSAPEPVAPSRPASLDFDLNLEASSPSGNLATIVTGDGNGPASAGGLDFDLGFEQSVTRGAGATMVVGDEFGRTMEVTSTRPQRVGEDFGLPDPSDLDFEISSEFGERNANPPVAPSVDVDLTATLADEGIRPPNDSATIDLERTNFDGNLLDFDFDLDDRSKADVHPGQATQTDMPAVDLSGIDLDLDRPTVEVDLPDAGPPTEPPLDMDLHQEVATKLELARAYEEMGDKDGARELVEEVLREGNGRQKDEAQAILARLG